MVRETYLLPLLGILAVASVWFVFLILLSPDTVVGAATTSGLSGFTDRDSFCFPIRYRCGNRAAAPDRFPHQGPVRKTPHQRFIP